MDRPRTVMPVGEVLSFPGSPNRTFVGLPLNAPPLSEMPSAVAGLELYDGSLPVPRALIEIPTPFADPTPLFSTVRSSNARFS